MTPSCCDFVSMLLLRLTNESRFLLRFGAWHTPQTTCCLLQRVLTGQSAFGRLEPSHFGIHEQLELLLAYLHYHGQLSIGHMDKMTSCDMWIFFCFFVHSSVAGKHRLASDDPAQKPCKLGVSGRVAPFDPRELQSFILFISFLLLHTKRFERFWQVWSLAWSPDGSRLATGGANTELWLLATFCNSNQHGFLSIPIDDLVADLDLIIGWWQSCIRRRFILPGSDARILVWDAQEVPRAQVL